MRSALIETDNAAEVSPLVESLVHKDAQLMTDQNPVYQQIGKEYAAHSWVNHNAKEFARGDTHNNTAESFNSIVERAKQGVFHYMSKKHLPRYLNEIGFRWDHRVPKEHVTKKGKKKTKMIAIPVIDLLHSLLGQAWGRQLRRSKNGAIFCPVANPAGP